MASQDGDRINTGEGVPAVVKAEVDRCEEPHRMLGQIWTYRRRT